MRGVVTNELGQWRSPSNMALISMMIHSWPDESAKVCYADMELTPELGYFGV